MWLPPLPCLSPQTHLVMRQPRLTLGPLQTFLVRCSVVEYHREFRPRLSTPVGRHRSRASRCRPLAAARRPANLSHHPVGPSVSARFHHRPRPPAPARAFSPRGPSTVSHSSRARRRNQQSPSRERCAGRGRARIERGSGASSSPAPEFDGNRQQVALRARRNSSRNPRQRPSRVVAGYPRVRQRRPALLPHLQGHLVSRSVKRTSRGTPAFSRPLRRAPLLGKVEKSDNRPARAPAAKT